MDLKIYVCQTENSVMFQFLPIDLHAGFGCVESLSKKAMCKVLGLF
jgi:hypothetical protein